MTGSVTCSLSPVEEPDAESTLPTCAWSSAASSLRSIRVISSARFNLADAQVSLETLLEDRALWHDAEVTYRKILADLIEGRADVRPLVEQLLSHRALFLFHRPASVARSLERVPTRRRWFSPKSTTH